MDSRFRFLLTLAILLVVCGNFVSAVEAQEEFSSHFFKIRYVNDSKEIQYVIDQFQSQLRRLGSNASIIACNNAAEVTEEGVKGRSVGAFCSVQDGNMRTSVLFCENSSSGMFNWIELGRLPQGGVVQFIKANCPTGS